MSTESSSADGHEYTHAAWKELLEVGLPKVDKVTTKNPVFVWQMGKVGSSAVAHSIERLGEYAVFHFHHTNANTIKRVIQAKRGAKVALPMDLLLSEKLLHVMDGIKAQKNEKIYVISAVRDPIARNVSAFFENLNVYAPDVDVSSGRDAQKLRELFLQTYSHATPTNWFDLELRFTAGIDVYKTPFDREKHTLRLSQAPFELLILRAEDDDRKKSMAMNELFGRSDIKLKKYNVAGKKDYAKLYSAFMDGLTFEAEFLDAQYSSKFCRHFYTDKELGLFKKRWGRAE